MFKALSTVYSEETGLLEIQQGKNHKIFREIYQNEKCAQKRSKPITNNMKLQAVNYSSFKQSLLDIGIKAAVFVILSLLDFVSAGLSNGSFQLPSPQITLPILTLLVSQLDSYFVNYANANNVPVPTEGKSQGAK